MDKTKTFAIEPEDKFYCERCKCWQRGADCVRYMRLSGNDNCKGCEIGEQHEALFGSDVANRVTVEFGQIKPYKRKLAAAAQLQEIREEAKQKEDSEMGQLSIDETRRLKQEIEEICDEMGFKKTRVMREARVGKTLFYRPTYSLKTADKLRAWIREQEKNEPSVRALRDAEENTITHEESEALRMKANPLSVELGVGLLSMLDEMGISFAEYARTPVSADTAKAISEWIEEAEPKLALEAETEPEEAFEIEEAEEAEAIEDEVDEDAVPSNLRLLSDRQGYLLFGDGLALPISNETMSEFKPVMAELAGRGLSAPELSAMFDQV